MNFEKIVFSLGFIIIILIAIYAYYSSGPISSLKVSFDLQEKLEIKICNPTNRAVVFADTINGGLGGYEDNILHTDQVSIIYKKNSPTTITLDGPFINLRSHGTMATHVKLAPNKCTKGYVNIRKHIPDDATSFMFDFKLYPFWDHTEPNSTVFKSQWFEK